MIYVHELFTFNYEKGLRCTAEALFLIFKFIFHKIPYIIIILIIHIE